MNYHRIFVWIPDGEYCEEMERKCPFHDSERCSNPERKERQLPSTAPNGYMDLRPEWCRRLYDDATLPET